MPIYEYKCQKCQHEFEREQRITADPITTCPSCKARRVKKLISQTSFVLKGGGWYNDLYSSSKKVDKSDSADKNAEAKTDDKKTDNKTSDKKADGNSKSESKSTKASDKSSKNKSSKSAA